MFRNRRFACTILGMWLGAAVCVDVFVIQSSFSGDHFISDPGSPDAAAQIKQIGAQNLRFILRRNAAEDNALISAVWEWAQIGLAAAFFFLILFGERPPVPALILIPAILAIVLLQRLLLTPHIVSMARDVDELPAAELVNNPTVVRFQAFRGAYWIAEILKLLFGVGIAGRLMVRRDTSHSSKSRESGRGVAGTTGRVSASEERARERRKSQERRVTDRNPNG